MIKRLNKQWLSVTARYLKENVRFVCLVGSLIIGITIGALLIRNALLTDIYDPAISIANFISARSTGSFGILYLHSFSSSLIYLLLSYICGLFLIGTVPSYFLPTLRGLGIGVVCGYLYANHGMQGVAFSFLLILPCTFLQSIVFLIGCQEASKFSAIMFRHFAQKSIAPIDADVFKKYNIRFAVLLFFTALIALPDALLSKVFIGIFGF